MPAFAGIITTKGSDAMYPFLNELLKDKKGTDIFTLFSGWHWFYILLTAAAVAVLLITQKRKHGEIRERCVRFFADLAFALYIADLFLMPIAYGEIDIEKLPFHACTAMCIMCFLSYRVKFLQKYQLSFTFLGLISNVVYLVYPAGVMWHAVHPLSYRVIQTLIFHSVMSVYGILYLVREYKNIELKNCHRELAVVCAMTEWAIIGNYIYNGSSGEYSHFFNWFFVVQDPFYILPQSIAPFIMPLLNILIFFAAEMLIHLVIWAIKKYRSGKARAVSIADGSQA